MFRINSSGSVEGRFSDGNPQIGQRATVVSAAWCNAIQEEIVNVILHAGIALDGGSETQLRDAIAQLIANALGEGGGEEGAVPITRTVEGTGLATGGGPLNADLEIDVAKASAGEINTGTEDGKAITPKGLRDAAGGVLSTIGYMRLPGTPLIVQWGAANAASNSTTVVTLPTTFPAACAFAGCSGGTMDGGAEENNPTVVGRGTTSISIYSARDSSVAVNWVAIGY